MRHALLALAPAATLALPAGAREPTRIHDSAMAQAANLRTRHWPTTPAGACWNR